MGDLQATIEFMVELYKFYNVDLFIRGNYQLRLTFKPPKCAHCVQVEACDFQGATGAFTLFPAFITTDGQTAVSRTFNIYYKDEEVLLKDVFLFRVHLLIDSTKAADCIEKTTLEMNVDVHFTDQVLRETNYKSLPLVTSRTLQFHFSSFDGLHHLMPLLFDYYYFSVLDLVIHANVVSLGLPDWNILKPIKTGWFNKASTPRSSSPLFFATLFGKQIGTQFYSDAALKYALPTSPITRENFEKASAVHRNLCVILAMAHFQLLNYFEKMMQHFDAKMRIKLAPKLDPADLVEGLCKKLETLQSCEEVFDEICSDLSVLNNELSLLWSQFQESFALNDNIRPFLRERHHRERMLHFSEAFFVHELPWKSLLTQSDGSAQKHTTMGQCVKSSRYLTLIPPVTVECAEVDGDSSTTPIFFEDRYVETKESSVSEVTVAVPQSISEDEVLEHKPLSLGILNEAFHDGSPKKAKYRAEDDEGSGTSDEWVNIRLEKEDETSIKGTLEDSSGEKEKGGTSGDSLGAVQPGTSEDTACEEVIDGERQMKTSSAEDGSSRLDEDKEGVTCDNGIPHGTGGTEGALRDKKDKTEPILVTDKVEDSVATEVNRTDSKENVSLGEDMKENGKGGDIDDVKSDNINEGLDKNRMGQVSMAEDDSHIEDKSDEQLRHSGEECLGDDVITTERDARETGTEDNLEVSKCSVGDSAVVDVEDVLGTNDSSRETCLSEDGSSLSGGSVTQHNKDGSQLIEESEREQDVESGLQLDEEHKTQQNSKEGLTLTEKSKTQQNTNEGLQGDGKTEEDSADDALLTKEGEPQGDTTIDSKLTGGTETLQDIEDELTKDSSQLTKESKTDENIEDSSESTKESTTQDDAKDGPQLIGRSKLKEDTEDRSQTIKESKIQEHSKDDLRESMEQYTKDDSFSTKEANKQDAESDSQLTKESKTNDGGSDLQLTKTSKAEPVNDVIPCTVHSIEDQQVNSLQTNKTTVSKKVTTAVKYVGSETKVTTISAKVQYIPDTTEDTPSTKAFALERRFDNSVFYDRASKETFEKELLAIEQQAKEESLNQGVSNDDDTLTMVSYVSSGDHVSCFCGGKLDKSSSPYQLSSDVDKSNIKLDKAKKDVKARLNNCWSLYSDSGLEFVVRPYFMDPKPDLSTAPVHFVVCVHGLDGNSGDLRLLRCFLEMALPSTKFEFLMSEINQDNTFLPFDELTEKLVSEIIHHIEAYRVTPSRISFIGHSLGNIIIRSALTHPLLEPYVAMFHTFLSLSGPHLGMIYHTSSLVSTGLWLMQKLKKSASLLQLSLNDSSDLRETFLYKLSKKKGLEYFSNVLLVSSVQDHYVPFHSSRIELPKSLQRSNSQESTVYREMVENILTPLSNQPNRTFVRYSVYHCLPSSTNSFIGRAAHIAMLDSELFIEKLICRSAAKYFQ